MEFWKKKGGGDVEEGGEGRGGGRKYLREITIFVNEKKF